MISTLRPSSRIPARTLLGFVLLLAGLWMGVFVLPYAVSAQSGVISASSLAGYNNAAAYGFYLMFGVLNGLLLAVLLKHRPLAPLSEVCLTVRWSPTPAVWAVLITHVGFFGLLYAVKGYFPFGDGMYFQHILVRMVEGAVPYRDVNFLYGPAMLYPAYWLTPFVSVTAAYGLYYITIYLAGLYLLYLSVQVVTADTRAAAQIFLLFALGMFNLLIGLNYVFIRHLLPVATLFLVWGYLREPSVRKLLLAAAALFVTLAYSIEMGVLTILALGVLGLARAVQPWWPRLAHWTCESDQAECLRPISEAIPATLLRPILRVAAVCGSGIAGLGALFVAIDPSLRALAEALRPILSYSAGAGNSPVYPSLPFLTLVAVSICVLALALQRLQEVGCRPHTDLLLALLALAFLLQRAAFGKPDAPHIAYSGLPMFLLACFLWPPRFGAFNARRWLQGAMLIGVFIPLQLFNLFLFKPVIERRLSAWTGPNTVVASVPAGTKAGIQDSLRRMLDHFGPERTYYLHILSYYSLPLAMEFRLRQVPYVSTLDEVFTKAEMAAIIHELRSSRAVVISRRQDLDPALSPNYETGEGWLYQLAGAPLPGSRSYFEVVAANNRLREPLNVFLRSSYEEVFEDGELVGLVLRPVPVS